MWRRRYMHHGSHYGFPHLSFLFHGFRPFPLRKEYLSMLEGYKKRLEEELKEINEEIEELTGKEG